MNGPTEFTDRYPIKIQWTTAPTKFCEHGDILLCVRGSSTGRMNIANDIYCIGRGLAAIRTGKANDQGFLIYVLQHQIDEILKLTSGTTFPNIDGKTLQSLLIPEPPLPEQQKIASILSAVDNKLDLIDRKITASRTLKKGLMQRLFSQGVGSRDANGHWQPHTEFKDSELGRIPAGWEVKTLKESRIATIDGDRGIHYPKLTDFCENGYCLFLSAKNVTKNGFSFSECQFITEEKDNQLRKGKLKKNDIVITTRGTVGNIAYYRNNSKFANVRINSGMAILRINNDEISGSYIYKTLQSPVIDKQLDKLVFGSAQPQLTIKTINELMIPLPPKEEQKEIAKIISAVDRKIEHLLQKKTQTQHLKKGLMQKLLTGQLRVTTEQESTSQ